MELKNKELKNRKEKLKRKIDELYYKPITLSKDDMDKSEEEETEKWGQLKNNWYDC